MSEIHVEVHALAAWSHIVRPLVEFEWDSDVWVAVSFCLSDPLLLLAVAHLETVGHDVLSHRVPIEILRACRNVVAAWTVRIYPLLELIQKFIAAVSL